MLTNHRVKTIPNIGTVNPSTIRAYARSRGLSVDLKDAFVECREIRDDCKALPSDVRNCHTDAVAYENMSAGIPAYVMKALDIIRQWQLQLHSMSP